MAADGSGTPRKLPTGPGCASSPAWSPDGKRIAFTSGQGSDESAGAKTEIYVANAFGEEGHADQPQALTDSTPGSASDPDWSPDGSEIAFTYGASSGDMGSIYTMKADGSGETPITRSQHWTKQEGAYQMELADGKSSPAWSPDGDRIAYVRLVPDCEVPCGGGYTLYAQEIHIINTDGSDPTLLKDFGRGHDVTGLDLRALP